MVFCCSQHKVSYNTTPKIEVLSTESDNVATLESRDEISEEILKMIEEHGLTEELAEVETEVLVHEDSKDDVAFFVESRRGKTVLQYNDFRYRRAYKTKHGTRWNCSVYKNCPAFVYINDNNEMIMTNEDHVHEDTPVSAVTYDNTLGQSDTAVVITSRKGKEMLLFRQYTYRKQYAKGERCRWVCSTLKNCRGCVFTDSNNFITSAYEDHCHAPPKYYLKPSHVLEALREPLIIETD